MDHPEFDCKTAYIEKRVRGSFLPKVYVVEPTSRCNINCIMCPNDKLGYSRLGDMNLAMAEDIADKIAPSAELVMLYFMGEPLLHRQYSDIVRCFRTHTNAKIVVSTNATLVDEDFLEVIREGSVDTVIACIDGWTAGDYERVRRGANFATVVQNVERICVASASGSTTIIAKMLDFGFEAHTIEAFKNYWSRLGAVPLVGWVDTWAGQFPNLARIAGIKAPYDAKERSACADLWFKMVINWKGEVVLCCHNWNYSIVIGNLSQQTVADAWHSDAIVSTRASHLAQNYACNSICRKCREWGEIDELDVYIGSKTGQLDLVF